jgi:predicted transcriptional regulator of viral defense system
MAVQVERKAELFKLADQQAGYFTASQAKALGYSDRVQHHHKQQGNWIEAGWGLYRLRDYPHSENEDLVRLSLWSRNKQGEVQAVVSHDTALRLYGLSDWMPSQYHLTVPPGFRKQPLEGVVLHKAILEESDLEDHGNYWVTTPLHTLLDLAKDGFSLEHLEVAVRQALQKGMVRRKALEQALPQFPSTVQPLIRHALKQALEQA